MLFSCYKFTSKKNIRPCKCYIAALHFRSFCLPCIKYLLCPESFEDVILEFPWICFLCNFDNPRERHLLTVRDNWRQNEMNLFNSCFEKSGLDYEIFNNSSKLKLNVFSAFDGLAGGKKIFRIS